MMSGYQKIKKMPRWRLLREKIEKIIFAGSWPSRLGILTGYQGEIRVTYYRISVKNFPAAKQPLHFVFASDFHMGPTTHAQHIKNALQKIRALQPDILLLGGDFVYLEAKNIDAFVELLDTQIPTTVDKFAVPGNHDNHLDANYISDVLQKHGVRMLTNKWHCLSPPYDFISLHGLDDWLSGEPDVSSAFENSAAIKIVLMHSPSNYLDLQDIDFDLAFCGHTHGGQIAFADGSPLRAGSGPLSRLYNFGLFRPDVHLQKTLIVSRGVGFGSLPFRINSRPEIISCRLLPDEAN